MISDEDIAEDIKKEYWQYMFVFCAIMFLLAAILA